MNSNPIAETESDIIEHSERNVLLMTYVLYGLGCFFFLTAIAGVIVNHVKMSELPRSSIAWSHHRWLMRTFWLAMLWNIVCLVLTPIGVGVIGYAVLWVWCVYRFIRGLMTYIDRRAMPAPGY